MRISSLLGELLLYRDLIYDVSVLWVTLKHPVRACVWLKSGSAGGGAAVGVSFSSFTPPLLSSGQAADRRGAEPDSPCWAQSLSSSWAGESKQRGLTALWGID